MSKSLSTIMPQPHRLTQKICCLVAVVALSTSAVPATAAGPEADLVGSWELASFETRSEAGEWEPTDIQLTGTPVGILMYGEQGNMAVQITSEPRGTANPPDIAEIVNGYIAYYGRYEVDPDHGTVTHHRKGHINPESGGISVVRFYEFTEDGLTLTLAPERRLRVHWVRARASHSAEEGDSKMSQEWLEEFGARYTAAWSSHDPDRVASFYTEQGSLTVNGGDPMVGRAAIAAFAKSFDTAFPDFALEMDAVRTDRNGIEYHWTFTGTNNGPDGTGRAVRFSGFEQWVIGEDGLIASSQGNFDEADYQRQLRSKDADR